MTPLLGIVGAGKWGKNHVRTAHEMGVLGGIIEPDPSIQSTLKDTYPNTPVFSSIHDPGALAYPAYTIAVPVAAHYDIAHALLTAGKHVLVEKPLTLTTTEATDLIACAKQHNCQLLVGHLLLFHPAIRTLKHYIESGKIGTLQYLYSNRLNLGTVRTEENSLWSFAPHDISIFHYLTQEKPLTVTAHGGAFLQSQIHDTTITCLQYPNNITAHIFVSWLHPFKEHRLVVVGSKGMLSFEDSSPGKSLLYYEKGIQWKKGKPIAHHGPTQQIDYDATPPLQAEFQHFIDCIENRTENNVISGEKGLAVLQVLADAQRALDHAMTQTE